MLYSVSTKLPIILTQFRNQLAQEVGTGKITNSTQLDFVIEYLMINQKKGGVDLNAYVKDCGIGLHLT
jgi:hypothetical protein